jgi:hypothetical protein
MQSIGAGLLTFALGSISLIAAPLLTAPGSGAFEYMFSGNTVAEFGATELFLPGKYQYPFFSTYPFPYSPPVLDMSVTLSSSGVWTFRARSTLCCWSEWVLTPSSAQVPGLGVTTYDSVVSEFFDVTLQSSRVVAGTAKLTISAVPEPGTLWIGLWGFGVVCLSSLVWRRRITRRIGGSSTHLESHYPAPLFNKVR